MFQATFGAEGKQRTLDMVVRSRPRSAKDIGGKGACFLGGRWGGGGGGPAQNQKPGGKKPFG